MSKVPDLDLLCNPFKLKAVEEKGKKKIHIPSYHYNEKEEILKLIEKYYYPSSISVENRDSETYLLENSLKNMIQTCRILLKYKHRHQSFDHDPDQTNDDIGVDYHGKK